jgi:FlaA1/EpsC-like NDP-sugar epimerase
MHRFNSMGSRASAAFAHDVVMAALSFFLSFYLRVGGAIHQFPASLLLAYGLGFAATAGIVFLSTGLYRGIWRYASLPDLIALVKAASLVILIFFPLIFLATRGEALPRSLIVINWMVLVALLGGPRFLYRVIKDGNLDHILERTSRVPIPVLVIGAREDADLFIRTTRRDPERLYRVVGLIADNAMRVGRDMGGVPVLGTIDRLRDVVTGLTRRGDRPQRIVISTRSLSGSEVRNLLDLADELGIPLARLPRLTEFRDTVDSRRIEPIAIEDLLGRPQTVLDRAAMKALIAGRRVLVTGAGGTIGSELARQIAAYGPARLALLDNGEFALYGIDREIAESFPRLARTALIGDVRERRRLDETMAAERPELVFHAAALKHVPIVEANPCEGILTNVLGTRNVAEACRAAGVKAMVMISTDKAVNPANVMGATKRLAESLCQALDVIEAKRANGTRFLTVRFGNVLGSTGSVVPLFQRQLAAGGPLTVTHPEIARFFMTVREAVELVLQASALGLGDAERGRIYVLDMGQPIKIVDLARQMIRLAGLKPDRDIAIDYIGLRPGEKLQEELFHVGETPLPTSAPGILLAAPRTSDYAMLQRPLDELLEQAREQNEERALSLLEALVPEYHAPPASPRAAAEH